MRPEDFFWRDGDLEMTEAGEVDTSAPLDPVDAALHGLRRRVAVAITPAARKRARERLREAPERLRLLAR